MVEPCKTALRIALRHARLRVPALIPVVRAESTRNDRTRLFSLSRGS